MRLHVDDDASWLRKNKVVVLYNDQPVQSVILADEEKGCLIRYVRDDQGRLVRDGDGLQQETLWGRVSILDRAVWEKTLCDCGGHKARTTHSDWCSSLAKL